jgi:hypothetical protein
VQADSEESVRRQTSRGVALLVLVVVLGALAACNPTIGTPWQGTTIRTLFDGPQGGWVEVQVRDASAAPVPIGLLVRAAPESVSPCLVRSPDPLAVILDCTAPMFVVGAVGPDGTSLGYQRVAWVPARTALLVDLQVGVESYSGDARIDVRVVDDNGSPVGDLGPQPPPTFKPVSTAIS